MLRRLFDGSAIQREPNAFGAQVLRKKKKKEKNASLETPISVRMWFEGLGLGFKEFKAVLLKRASSRRPACICAHFTCFTST